MNQFQLQFASDVIRDGLGVELLDSYGDVIAEVFRSDREHTLIVSTFGDDISVQDMKRLLEVTDVELDPFEDGTPLSEAKTCPARPSASS